MNEIFQITMILLSCLIASIISKRIGIPAVVGQLLVGIILAPSVLNIVHPSELIHVLSEVGVILLMFLAGLESDLAQLKKYFWPSIRVAIWGVLVPLISFTLVGMSMNEPLHTSIFYGIVFAATSVSITVEVLQEYGKLSSRAGAIILGAAVADDIIAVLLLSFFTSTDDGGSSGSMILKVLLQLAFLAFLFLVYKLVPILFKFVDKIPVFAKFTSVSIILCLLLSLLADAVGMSAVIGAFFTGVAIGQTQEAHKIVNYSSTIASVFFVPIFFVSIALSIQFDGILKDLPLIIGFTILALLTKFLPSYLSGRRSKLSPRDSALIGSGMISRGEMALIVLQVGFASHLVSKEIYSSLILVIILTTLIAPFLIKASIKKEKKHEN